MKTMKTLFLSLCIAAASFAAEPIKISLTSKTSKSEEVQNTVLEKFSEKTILSLNDLAANCADKGNDYILDEKPYYAAVLFQSYMANTRNFNFK